VGVVMLLDRALGDRRCPIAEQRKQRIPSRTFQKILTFPAMAHKLHPLDDVHFDCLLEGLARLASK
jgi:hypothetical protein